MDLPESSRGFVFWICRPLLNEVTVGLGYENRDGGTYIIFGRQNDYDEIKTVNLLDIFGGLNGR